MAGLPCAATAGASTAPMSGGVPLPCCTLSGVSDVSAASNSGVTVSLAYISFANTGGGNICGSAPPATGGGRLVGRRFGEKGGGARQGGFAHSGTGRGFVVNLYMILRRNNLGFRV
eukprot:354169-Chlamydomonas_euryale.AAC.9